uniref:ATP-dependent DNA helicase n=1 Tax=Lactuca sativa TaxID=4236 RepID=A0A9R1XB82_LACSA|nr:hypothetical protein LSAT_V11C500286950 [Lactuca sativa]
MNEKISLTVTVRFLVGCRSVLLGGDSRPTLLLSPKSIGDGDLGYPDVSDTIDARWIDIPSSLMIPPGEAALQNLIHFMFRDGIFTTPSSTGLSARAIVCPKNKTTHHINDLILNITPRNMTNYKSVGLIEPNGNQTLEFESFYPTEYLNQLNFPSIPSHILSLKLC